MKSYYIISNSLKQLLCLLFSVFFAIHLQAQNLSNSPYSRFGIGDLQTIQAPRNAAMGGLSVGLTGTSNLSAKNPASYLNLDSLRVMFDVNLQATYSQLSEKQPNSEETASAKTNNVSLGQISFAFPITSRLKSCFGLMPTSNMSYDVYQEISADENPYIGKRILNNYGQGGLNQVFLGLAAGTSRIAVGANVNYLFGSFIRGSNLAFVDTILPAPVGTFQEKYIETAGISWDLGLQYRQPLANKYQLGVGFTYSPQYNLNATKRMFAYSGNVRNGIVDTASSFLDTLKGVLQIPDKYSVGLSFGKPNRWVIGIEYTMMDFAKYKEIFKKNGLELSQSEQNLSNAYTFRAGMELIGRRMDNDFFNRLSYRLGYHYGTDCVFLNSEQIKQFGFSFGVGIPVRRTQSRIDFAVELGRKGNVNAGQIQETYGRIIIGISAFEQWFTRMKFD